jgi:hypothetical protein
MMQTQAPHSHRFIKLLAGIELRIAKLLPDAVKGCELRAMALQEGSDFPKLTEQLGAWMQADCPDAGLLIDWLPKLLWNPSHTAAQEGHARHAVGEPLDSLCMKSLQRVAVKAVARCYP